MNSLKNIADILQHSNLNRIVEKSSQINDMNYRLQQRFPNAYKTLFRVANVYPELIVLDVQNATVRQGFIVRKKQILEIVQSELPSIKDIEININPSLV